MVDGVGSGGGGRCCGVKTNSDLYTCLLRRQSIVLLSLSTLESQAGGSNEGDLVVVVILHQ